MKYEYKNYYDNTKLTRTFELINKDFFSFKYNNIKTVTYTM